MRHRRVRRTCRGSKSPAAIEGGDLGGSGFKVGDPVCALVAGGGYAEQCVAPAAQCLPVPRGLTFVGSRGAAGDVLHGVEQRVRPARTGARRVAARAGRHQRHRRRGDPAGACVRQHRFTPPRAATTSAAPASNSARRARSTTAREDFVGGDQGGDRRTRRQRDPRHGGRRLPAARGRVPGRRWPACRSSRCSAARRPRSTWRRCCGGG